MRADNEVFTTADSGTRVEIIDALYRVDGSVGGIIRTVYLKLVAIDLHVVEVEWRSGHHDAVATLVGSLTGVFHAAPRHDDRMHSVAASPVCQKFVPHDDILAIVVA